jgi:hypothetical protein
MFLSECFKQATLTVPQPATFSKCCGSFGRCGEAGGGVEGGCVWFEAGPVTGGFGALKRGCCCKTGGAIEGGCGICEEVGEL